MKKLVPWTPEEEAVIWDEIQKNYPAMRAAFCKAAERLNNRTYHSISRHFYYYMKPSVKGAIGNGKYSPPALLLSKDVLDSEVKKLITEQENKIRKLESEIAELRKETRPGEVIIAQPAKLSHKELCQEKFSEIVNAVCNLVSCINAYQRASEGSVGRPRGRRKKVAI